MPRRRSTLPVLARFTAPAAARLAVGLLGFVAFAVGLSHLQAAHEQAVLHDRMRAEIADPGEVLTSIPSGTPLALMEIEAIGLEETVVVQGTSADDLTSGVGHRRDSVLPGQTGLSVLYGRHSTFGAPFGDLGGLDPGDLIEVTTPDGEFAYRVDEVRRDGDPIPAREAGDSWLVLVSAEGDPFRPTTSLYVDATLVDRTFTAGAATEATALEAVGANEIAMASDPGAWFPLVLWLQVLVAVLVGMSWVRHRMGRTESLVMGLPAAAAALWSVYEAATRLLPNLL